MAPSIVETWKIKGKNKRVYVARDNNGAIVTWRLVSGSGMTKDEAIETFSKNRTFKADTKKINFPDSKKQIEITTSTRDARVPKRFQQLGIVVRWRTIKGRILGEATGYSKLLSKKPEGKHHEEDAFDMARARAISDGIITYKDKNFEIIETFYQSYITKFRDEQKSTASV